MSPGGRRAHPAAYVTFESARALIGGAAPDPSPLGMALAVVQVVKRAGIPRGVAPLGCVGDRAPRRLVVIAEVPSAIVDVDVDKLHDALPDQRAGCGSPVEQHPLARCEPSILLT